jgi:opacity protein-like surface antigen
MKKMKLIVIGAALAALAIPSVASASQPVKPGGFGTDRAYALTTPTSVSDGHAWSDDPGASEMGIAASERAGDNGAINNAWKIAHDELPTESNAGL